MSTSDEQKQQALDQSLSQAVEADNVDAICAYLQEGANPNSEEFMPLCWAAGKSSPAAIAKLISGGADPNIRDHEGFTPINYAIAYNNGPACDYLLQSIPDLHLRTHKNSALLSTVNPEYRQEFMIRLLDAGADPYENIPHDTKHISCINIMQESRNNDALHIMQQYTNTPIPSLEEMTHNTVATPDNPTLQLPRGWQQFAAITDTLERQGTPLTKADLLCPFGDGSSSYLRRAAECLHLPAAMEYLNSRDEHITADDLLQENGEPNALMTSLIERQALRHVMTTDNWRNQKPEQLSRVWEATPPKERDTQMPNYHRLRTKMTQQQRENSAAITR